MRLASILTLNVVIATAALAVAWPRTAHKTAAKVPALRDGDLLFQTMAGGQSDAIAQATRCKWTHVGVAFQEGGSWVVYEAVGPVKKTDLSAWVAQGDGHYCVKRWTESDTRLTGEAVAELRKACTPYLGRAYDWEFRWSDEKIYCSELVWKIYADALGVRLCEPKPLKDYDLGSDVVRRTMQERYGSAPPLDELMVAPATLFTCPLLTTVTER